MRVGLIGCGRIMEEYHAKAWFDVRDKAQILAVADPSTTRINLLAGLFEVPESRRFADYREMLNHVDLDVVDIAVPNFLHEQIIVEAAQHQLDILSEKPLATSLEAADRILKIVEESDRHFAIWHNYIYEPLWMKIIEMTRGNLIGEPRLIRHEILIEGYYAGTSEYDSVWRTQMAQAGGGALLDNGYHYIYLCEAEMGSPITNVYACVRTYVLEQNVEDTAFVLLTHANGGITSLQFSCSFSQKSKGCRGLWNARLPHLQLQSRASHLV